MDTATISLGLNALLATLVIVLTLCLAFQNRKVSKLNREAAYAEGYAAGRKAAIDSIRYEREVFECRRAGLMRRETAVKLREGVFLGNLRIAQSEHEIVLSSEVNEENLWNVLDRATRSAVSPEVTSVVQVLAPGVKHLLNSREKSTA